MQGQSSQRLNLSSSTKVSNCLQVEKVFLIIPLAKCVISYNCNASLAFYSDIKCHASLSEHTHWIDLNFRNFGMLVCQMR